MTLEVRDVESVEPGADGVVIGLSLTRAPDDLETELIERWPVPEGTSHTLTVQSRLLVLKTPDQATALASTTWLMGPHGLGAIADRAQAMQAASDQLLNDLRTMVHRQYDEA